MGLIRPRLVKTSDHTWAGSFNLPTCDLKDMNWNLKLLIQDQKNQKHEIKFRFSSINFN